MNGNADARPPADEAGPTPARPGDEANPTSPVGDMFEEGETDVGPHPSLINVENWESSDLHTSAGSAGADSEGTARAGSDDQDPQPDV